MIDGKFTAKERAYLASLPAVKSVSPSHIRYTDRFKVEVMCRYNAGESPSAIFREAGLRPQADRLQARGTVHRALEAAGGAEQAQERTYEPLHAGL